MARLFAWTLLGVRLLVFDLLEVVRAHSINDYGSFHFAALAITDGHSPYDVSVLRRLAADNGMDVHPYFYPPLLAELLTPMTLLEIWPARLIWGALNVAAFALAFFLLDRWVAQVAGPRASDARVFFAVTMAVFWPIRQTQWMAQVNAIVLLLVVLWWTRRERSPWSGAWLGVAIAIKMSPALLLAFIVSRKAWREAATAAGVGAALVVISCMVLGRPGLEFLGVLTGFLPGGRWHELTVPINVFGNHSLAALAFALTGNRGEPFRLLGAAAWLHAGFAAALFVTWAWRARKVPASASLGALVVVMVVVPTYAYEHHLALAVVSIAIAIGGVDAAPRSVAQKWLLLLCLCFLSEHIDAFLPPPPPTLGEGHLRALWSLPKLYPMLLLFAILLWPSRQRAVKQIGVPATRALDVTQ